MEVKAFARNVRISPRKARLVIDLIRGLDVNEALAQLRFMSKAAVVPVTKLVRSAMANATHNFKLNAEDLYVKRITADAGPVLKRWRARAFGRAAPIRKRMAHLAVVLGQRSEAAPAGAQAAVVKSAAKAVLKGKAVGKAPAKSAAKLAPSLPRAASRGKSEGKAAARKPAKGKSKE